MGFSFAFGNVTSFPLIPADVPCAPTPIGGAAASTAMPSSVLLTQVAPPTPGSSAQPCPQPGGTRCKSEVTLHFNCGEPQRSCTYQVRSRYGYTIGVNPALARGSFPGTLTYSATISTPCDDRGWIEGTIGDSTGSAFCFYELFCSCPQ